MMKWFWMCVWVDFYVLMGFVVVFCLSVGDDGFGIGDVVFDQQYVVMGVGVVCFGEEQCQVWFVVMGLFWFDDGVVFWMYFKYVCELEILFGVIDVCLQIVWMMDILEVV